MTPPLGLIEGFFGRPYSWAERHDAAAFYGPAGYDLYLYAPKADPFLRRQWQQPHPPAEMEQLASFADACRAAGMRFGVGLSPFELHLHPGRDWEPLLARKLDMLRELRPDALAILFDDMRGDVPELAERQAAIVQFAAGRIGSDHLLCCPSYYSDDPVLDRAFGARPPHYLERLGCLLDAAIDIMWTGEEVCSLEFSPGHLQRVSESICRKPYLWDNYPVNDGSRMSQHLHLRAFTGRPAAISRHLSGHGVNLASQAVLSRVPALTLVESYRRGEAYEYGTAFRNAARVVLGGALADRVERDLLRLQDRGLDRLGDARVSLRENYTGFDHPAAREIIAWLDGYWDIADEIVHTQ